MIHFKPISFFRFLKTWRDLNTSPPQFSTIGPFPGVHILTINYYFYNLFTVVFQTEYYFGFLIYVFTIILYIGVSVQNLYSKRFLLFLGKIKIFEKHTKTQTLTYAYVSNVEIQSYTELSFYTPNKNIHRKNGWRVFNVHPSDSSKTYLNTMIVKRPIN